MMTTTRNRACRGKHPHESRASADGQRHSLIRRGAAPSSLRTYECRHCGKWHVGHVPRSKR